jgi:hypothetical protein
LNEWNEYAAKVKWEKFQSDYFEYQRKQEVQQQKNSSVAIQNTKRNMSAKCVHPFIREALVIFRFRARVRNRGKDT